MGGDLANGWEFATGKLGRADWLHFWWQGLDMPSLLCTEAVQVSCTSRTMYACSLERMARQPQQTEISNLTPYLSFCSTVQPILIFNLHNVCLSGQTSVHGKIFFLLSLRRYKVLSWHRWCANLSFRKRHSLRYLKHKWRFFCMYFYPISAFTFMCLAEALIQSSFLQM